MKAYFRRAEVLSAAGQYDLSLLLYGRALQLQPNDIAILNAAKLAAMLSNQQNLCKWMHIISGILVAIWMNIRIIVIDQMCRDMKTESIYSYINLHCR